MNKKRLAKLAGIQLNEHKDWMVDSSIQQIANRVADLIMDEADRYKERDDYKGDDPIEHVKHEMFELINDKLL